MLDTYGTTSNGFVDISVTWILNPRCGISSLLNVYCDPFFYIKHQCSAPWFWHIIPDSDLNVRSLFILWGIWNLIPCKFENLCYKRCLHNTPYVNLIVDFPSREYTNESVVLPQYKSKFFPRSEFFLTNSFYTHQILAVRTLILRQFRHLGGKWQVLFST